MQLLVGARWVSAVAQLMSLFSDRADKRSPAPYGGHPDRCWCAFCPSPLVRPTFVMQCQCTQNGKCVCRLPIQLLALSVGMRSLSRKRQA